MKYLSCIRGINNNKRTHADSLFCSSNANSFGCWFGVLCRLMIAQDELQKLKLDPA